MEMSTTVVAGVSAQRDQIGEVLSCFASGGYGLGRRACRNKGRRVDLKDCNSLRVGGVAGRFSTWLKRS